MKLFVWLYVYGLAWRRAHLGIEPGVPRQTPWPPGTEEQGLYRCGLDPPAGGDFGFPAAASSDLLRIWIRGSRGGGGQPMNEAINNAAEAEPRSGHRASFKKA